MSKRAETNDRGLAPILTAIEGLNASLEFSTSVSQVAAGGDAGSFFSTNIASSLVISSTEVKSSSSFASKIGII